MKAFAYVRVSTFQQDLSPEVQRGQLADYCRMKGYEVLPMDAEIGVSGSVPFASRPVGAEMIARLGEVDAFVFAKLDRAFRDVIDCLMTVERLRAAGKTIHFLDMGIDTSTPAGELCLTMMAGFARFERRRIAERVREAMAVAVSQGKRIGPAGFGYRNLARIVDGKKVDGGKWEPVESEAAALALIGKMRGKPLRAIAEALTAAEIPTRRGGKWAPETVRKIVGRME